MTVDEQRPAAVAGLRSATAWSYAQTLGKLGVTSGLALVLAAMLGPRAFGVITMALVIIHFIEMLQQQGLMPAIISRRELLDQHADTAFWMVLAVGALGAAMGWLAAPWWAAVNGLPELTAVLRALAVGVPLTSAVVVHEAILRRNLMFKQLALRTWVSALIGGVAGVAAALAGWGVWALVLQQLVTAAVAAAVLWTVSPWRPRARFVKSAAGELLGYSLRSSWASLGVFIGGRADVLLAGVFLGPTVVGLYRMGQRLTAMVVDVSARSMQGVSLPGLAAVQTGREEFARRLFAMQRLTTCLALPALGVLYGIAPDVQAVLGAQWQGTTEVIRLLAVCQALTSLTLLLGPAMQAVGRPGVVAVVMWVWAGATVLAIVVAAVTARGDGLVAMCVAVTAGSALATVILTLTARRVLRVPARAMLRAWAPGAGAGALALATSAALTSALTLAHPVLDVAVAAGAGTLAAGVCVLAGVPGARRRALTRFRR